MARLTSFARNSRAGDKKKGRPNADVVFLSRRVLDGGAHHPGGERRKIYAAAGRFHQGRAALGGLPQDQSAGPRAGAGPRQRRGARREHRDPALSRQALRTLADGRRGGSQGAVAYRVSSPRACIRRTPTTTGRSVTPPIKPRSRRSRKPASRPSTTISSRSTRSWPGREWFSDQYSVCDPYGFVFYTWGVRRELPMAELKNYTAFKDRMLQRPAVQRVVEQEKVKL